MDKEYIKQIANYIIDNHTISEAAAHFSKSTSSIKKYLAKIRDEKEEGYDPLLAERLKLAQTKMILEGQKKGGKAGKRAKSYEDFTAKMYAEAYLTGITLEQLSELSQIPKSTLHDMIRGIKDEELQKRIDEYVETTKLSVIDKVNNEQWKR